MENTNEIVPDKVFKNLGFYLSSDKTQWMKRITASFYLTIHRNPAYWQLEQILVNDWLNRYYEHGIKDGKKKKIKQIQDCLSLNNI